MSLTYELIGQRLKAAREQLGLKQNQVGEYLNVKREIISYYETGARPIDTITLSKLSNLYGYSLSYFLGTEDNAKNQMVAATLRAQDLSPDDLKTIGWVKRFTLNLSSINEMLEE